MIWNLASSIEKKLFQEIRVVIDFSLCIEHPKSINLGQSSAYTLVLDKLYRHAGQNVYTGHFEL